MRILSLRRLNQIGLGRRCPVSVPLGLDETGAYPRLKKDRLSFLVVRRDVAEGKIRQRFRRSLLRRIGTGMRPRPKLGAGLARRLHGRFEIRLRVGGIRQRHAGKLRRIVMPVVVPVAGPIRARLNAGCFLRPFLMLRSGSVACVGRWRL
jgi:hypothetical protein